VHAGQMPLAPLSRDRRHVMTFLAVVTMTACSGAPAVPPTVGRLLSSTIFEASPTGRLPIADARVQVDGVMGNGRPQLIPAATQTADLWCAAWNGKPKFRMRSSSQAGIPARHRQCFHAGRRSGKRRVETLSQISAQVPGCLAVRLHRWLSASAKSSNRCSRMICGRRTNVCVILRDRQS